jgi:hypothetical protein
MDVRMVTDEPDQSDRRQSKRSQFIQKEFMETVHERETVSGVSTAVIH